MKTNNSLRFIITIIAISSLFVTIGSITNQVFSSQSYNNEKDKINYPKFLACLSESEEVRGYATDTEIRDCSKSFFESDSELEPSVHNGSNTSDKIVNGIDLWPIPQQP